MAQKDCPTCEGGMEAFHHEPCTVPECDHEEPCPDCKGMEVVRNA
jgi:DnaJ-class molecular chaperone